MHHTSPTSRLIVYKKIEFLTDNIFGVMFNSNLKTFPKPCYLDF